MSSRAWVATLGNNARCHPAFRIAREVVLWTRLLSLYHAGIMSKAEEGRRKGEETHNRFASSESRQLDRLGEVLNARTGLLVVVQPRLSVARSIDRSLRKVERWPSETRGFLGRKEDLEFMSRAILTQLRSL